MTAYLAEVFFTDGSSLLLGVGLTHRQAQTAIDDYLDDIEGWGDAEWETSEADPPEYPVDADGKPYSMSQRPA